MWFGESEVNIRDVFDKARKSAPCVLFFDELDSIGNARGSSQRDAGVAGNRVMNQLLTEIDGVGSKKNLFIIGATNRPELLDVAFLRPGRLDHLIYIPLPDKPSRISILHSLTRKAPVSKNVYMDYVAELTYGFSGADMAELVQRAAKSAVREAIEADTQRQKLMEEADADNMDVEGDDPVPEITWRHFEKALIIPRGCVMNVDLVKYDQFRKKFDTTYTVLAGLPGQAQSAFVWPEENSAPLAVDDDLYS